MIVFQHSQVYKVNLMNISYKRNPKSIQEHKAGIFIFLQWRKAILFNVSYKFL